MAITDQLNLEPYFTTQSTINIGATPTKNAFASLANPRPNRIGAMPYSSVPSGSSKGVIDRFSDYVAERPNESESLLKAIGTTLATTAYGATSGAIKGYSESNSLAGAGVGALQGAQSSVLQGIGAAAFQGIGNLFSKVLPERANISREQSLFNPEIYDAIKGASDISGVNPMGAYKTNLIKLYTSLPKHLQPTFLTYMKNKGVTI